SCLLESVATPPRSLSFFNAPAPTETYTLSLHDALPILSSGAQGNIHPLNSGGTRPAIVNLRQELNIYNLLGDPTVKLRVSPPWKDRKSTRLNSSHVKISYAVFCLKKKNIQPYRSPQPPV